MIVLPFTFQSEIKQGCWFLKTLLNVQEHLILYIIFPIVYELVLYLWDLLVKLSPSELRADMMGLEKSPHTDENSLSLALFLCI